VLQSILDHYNFNFETVRNHALILESLENIITGFNDVPSEFEVAMLQVIINALVNQLAEHYIAPLGMLISLRELLFSSLNARQSYLSTVSQEQLERCNQLVSEIHDGTLGRNPENTSLPSFSRHHQAMKTSVSVLERALIQESEPLALGVVSESNDVHDELTNLYLPECSVRVPWNLYQPQVADQQGSVQAQTSQGQNL
jgi:hypothetical protein